MTHGHGPGDERGRDLHAELAENLAMADLLLAVAKAANLAMAELVAAAHGVAISLTFTPFDPPPDDDDAP